MAAAKERQRADAALAEGNGHPKELEWNGLTLTLPAEPPGDTLWGWAEAEDEGKNLGPAINLLKSFLGEEQMRDVREKVRELGLSLRETTEAILNSDTGLFAQVLELYGTEPGESSASEGS